MTKRYVFEAATLIVAAVLCATIANALAGRERKVALVASYPNALKVPGEPATTPVEPIASPPATTTEATQATPTGTQTSTTTVAPPTTTATATQPLSNSATTPQPRNPATSQPNPATSQPNPQPAPPPAHPADTTKFKPHPDKPYLELGYSDVAALHNAGALFLDARRTSVFEQGHIAGARPVSVWESDVDDKVRSIWNERNSEAEQAKPIVVYCAGGECEDSHNLAQKLFDAQFTNVYVYRDGFPDWQKHGGAVHTGGQP
jgi:rhodanese-related sulfurtransferase